MNSTSFNNLLQGIQHRDPKLYALLKLLGAEVIRHQLELFPPEDVGLIQDDAPATIPVLATFTYQLFSDNILLSWTLASGTAARYEIRAGGTSWETGNIVIQTDTSSARINPLTVGTHKYWIKGISEDGDYSASALSIDIIIPPIGGLSVTAQIIDNNVLLFWSLPSSTFRLSHFIVEKNGTEIGRVNSTFITVFEVVSGTYNYSVRAVDIAGNESAESSVNATVTQPPDYELRADLLSTLNGTLTEVKLISGPRLLCNVRTETWQAHFTDRGWTTPQDQINAGYPLFIQPSAPTGSYVETIDYGLIISNTVLTVSYNTSLIYGAGVTVQVSIETSTDNISYTAPVVGTTLFVASLRYARITVNFTAVN